ncbi:phage TMP domain-containing protein [Hylemonella gracilis str. Niagara R]|uniref:Phage TMP domain-containing protein n=1 Tax=Hylemonella gracilis str. Niagara R TaxID=1458275 RepID=A0A016XH72_9BURK|nr:phage tail tape measure protein [Hylemonella gracilis]EYC51444.1 phage TMP domain-containing protein [Hylemonella gracilis str. Niagara R]
MSSDVQIRILLEAADRASRSLKGIDRASREAADAITKSREELRRLNAQQAALDGVEKHKTAVREAGLQVKLYQSRLDALRNSGSASTAQITRAQVAVDKAKGAFSRASAGALDLRRRLDAMGVKNASQAQGQLRRDIDAANAAMQRQIGRAQQLAQRQASWRKLTEQHGKAMRHIEGLNISGAASLATGVGIGRLARGPINAFAEQEDAATQLQAAMMRSDGSAPEELAQIQALADKLGGTLPGTTADFQNMMTMLIRQGMSAKSILGGLGESAAYLGVQLQMPVTEAAEFAAKMQDATRTAEGDMMGLMDTIQRAYYSGVDSGNMLQGFTKMSPVLGMIRKEGVEGANALAPLLVMMDQAGMAGESSGNAIRKVFQAGLDAKKMAKANALLQDGRAGFTLDFTDGNGQHGGLDVMFKQLEKLSTIQDDVARTGIIKAMFGDDAETLQVLNTLMAKGAAGYEEIQRKMGQQASLQQRVNVQLGTLKNVMEAAEGAATNVAASIGQVLAPQLKEITLWLAGAAERAQGWIKENEGIVAVAAWVVAGIVAVATAFGVMSLTVAAVAGPLKVAMFLLQALGLAAKGNPVIAIITAVATLGGVLYATWEPFRKMIDWILNNVAKAAAWLGKFLGIKTDGSTYTGGGATPGATGALATPGTSAWATGGGAPLTATAGGPLMAPAVAGGAAATVREGDSIKIDVHASPGMDEAAVGRAVASEIRRLQNQQGARTRSALADVN